MKIFTFLKCSARGDRRGQEKQGKWESTSNFIATVRAIPFSFTFPFRHCNYSSSLFSHPPFGFVLFLEWQHHYQLSLPLFLYSSKDVTDIKAKKSFFFPGEKPTQSIYMVERSEQGFTGEDVVICLLNGFCVGWGELYILRTNFFSLIFLAQQLIVDFGGWSSIFLKCLISSKSREEFLFCSSTTGLFIIRQTRRQEV